MRPAKFLAQDVMYGLKRKKVLVQVLGIDEDVISITPPLTFGVDQVDRLVQALEEVFNEMAKSAVDEPPNSLAVVLEEGEAQQRQGSGVLLQQQQEQRWNQQIATGGEGDYDSMD